jgi:hypothetical protein
MLLQLRVFSDHFSEELLHTISFGYGLLGLFFIMTQLLSLHLVVQKQFLLTSFFKLIQKSFPLDLCSALH